VRSKSIKSSWLWDTLGIFFLLGIFYAFRIGSYPLFTPDEGRYSEVAREMVSTGDFITPHLNGVVFLDKPILYYWMQASAIKIFGLTEAALRFWPALLGILCCVFVYFAGRQLFNRKAGILAAFFLATSPLYYAGAHYANLDLEVASFISMSLLSLLLGIHSKKTGYFIAAYILAGLAMLTKGLMGIVFPMMITGAWILILNRWSLIKEARLGIGLLLFTAITIPWYIAAQFANPEFFHYFFVIQQFSRFLTLHEFNNQTPVWFYLPVIALGFFPWTLFLVQAMSTNLKKVWRNPSSYPIELFLLLWVFLILIFFTIPHSKVMTYILPIFPALALLVGNYISQKNFKLGIYILGVIAVIIALTINTLSAHFNTKTIKPLATYLNTIIKPEDEIATYDIYYQDLPIYTKRRITIMADWHSPTIPNSDNWVRELWYGMPFQDTSQWLINHQTFWQRWHNPKRMFVFLHVDDFAEFQKNAGSAVYPLGRYHNIVLASNQLNEKSIVSLK